MIKEQDYQFKIVIVGNQGVGKSSLFVRFCDDVFEDNYMPTIGVDFRFKVLNHDKKNIRLQIWDTAGQEKFRTITSAYYRSSQAVIIVYDRTDPESFEEIQAYWLNEARNNSDPNVHLVVAGNKSDMNCRIPDADITSLTESLGVPSYSLSAKTGEGVETMFRQICDALMKRHNARAQEREEVKLKKNAGSSSKKCCG